jgi:hypothetical protein
MFTFLAALSKPAAPAPLAAAPASAPAPDPAVEADDDDTQGCGWFDSSHELRTGLVVTEHTSADAVASALPLADWLELHLSGWRPVWAA